MVARSIHVRYCRCQWLDLVLVVIPDGLVCYAPRANIVSVRYVAGMDDQVQARLAHFLRCHLSIRRNAVVGDGSNTYRAAALWRGNEAGDVAPFPIAADAVVVGAIGHETSQLDSMDAGCPVIHLS